LGKQKGEKSWETVEGKMDKKEWVQDNLLGLDIHQGRVR
jgi:hypothetical protein